MTPGEMLSGPEPQDPKPDFNDPRTPWQGRTSFVCPICDAFAAQTWSTLMRRERGAKGEETEHIGWSTDGINPHSGAYASPIFWTQAQCAACKKFHTWRGNELIYPAKNVLPLPHPDMPEAVVPIYTEARDVAAVSRRAGAAMARATMEALLRNLLENDKDELIVLIDQVEPLVSRSLADLLMFVRHVGNSALHVKGQPNDSLVLVLDEKTTDALNALFVIVNRLVEELITEPAQTARLVGSVPETVKAKVEQLRAKRAQPGA